MSITSLSDTKITKQFVQEQEIKTMLKEWNLANSYDALLSKYGGNLDTFHKVVILCNDNIGSGEWTEKEVKRMLLENL